MDGAIHFQVRPGNSQQNSNLHKITLINSLNVSELLVGGGILAFSHSGGLKVPVASRKKIKDD